MTTKPTKAPRPKPTDKGILPCNELAAVRPPPCRHPRPRLIAGKEARSEEHTSELQSRETNSYAVFRLKKKTKTKTKFFLAGILNNSNQPPSHIY